MQFFFPCIFMVTETFMWAVMAYDLFVAISCHLLYTLVMSQKLCSLLMGASYSWSIACSFKVYTYLLLTLSFCGTNFINNFGSMRPLLLFPAMNLFISQQIILSLSHFQWNKHPDDHSYFLCFHFYHSHENVFNWGEPESLLYLCLHITSITIFHGTMLFLYCVPNSKSSWLMVKVASIFYTVVISMLKTLIYSLRNKDVKESVKKLINVKLLDKC